MNQIPSNWYSGGSCRAPGLIITEESEVVTVTETVEDAEELPDLDLAYDELEAIKQRVQQLRGKLMLADPCQLEGTLSQDVDASCLTAKEQMLQQLRRSNCQLRCRLRKHIQYLHCARKELKRLQDMRCQLHDGLHKMTAELDAFKLFKLSAKHQFGLCIERNEQIKASKVDEHDFTRLVREVLYNSQGRMRHLMPMRCHQQMYYDLTLELILIRIFLHTLFSNMVDNWNFCKRRLRINCRHKMLPPLDLNPPLLCRD